MDWRISIPARGLMVETTAWSVEDVFVQGRASAADVPIHFARSANPGALDGLDDHQKAWLAAQNFSGAAKRHVLVPGADGRLASVVLGLGDDQQGEPSGPSEMLTGLLAAALPAGTYRFASDSEQAFLAQLAWALGAYSFSRYRTKRDGGERAKLRLGGSDAARVIN